MKPEFVGQKFGNLMVVEIAGTDGKAGYWRCLCVCGNEKVAKASDVKNGRLVSCGCARIKKEGLTPKLLREQSAASCAKRRAKQREAGGSFTPEQITELYLKQRGRCANCGCHLGDKFHRDHRVALADGGTNDITNIELLCGPCNLKKSKKDPIAWANQNGRLL